MSLSQLTIIPHLTNLLAIASICTHHLVPPDHTREGKCPMGAESLYWKLSAGL